MRELQVTPSDAKVSLLEAEITRLRAALKPFADHATDWERINAGVDDPLIEGWAEGPANLPLTVGDLKFAQLVLQNPAI